MTTLAEQVASRVGAILARWEQPAPRPQADDVEAAVWAKCARAARHAVDEFRPGTPEHRAAWRAYAAVLNVADGTSWWALAEAASGSLYGVATGASHERQG